MHDILALLEKEVAKVKEDLKSRENAGSLESLLTQHYKVVQLYRELDNIRKSLYHIQDYYSKNVIPKWFDERGLDQVSVSELSRSFYPISKTTARLVDKDKAFAWLRSLGAGDMVTETVHAGALGAFLRERALAGESDPPEDVVKMNMYQLIGSSAYTPKGE